MVTYESLLKGCLASVLHFILKTISMKNLLSLLCITLFPWVALANQPSIDADALETGDTYKLWLEDHPEIKLHLAGKD